MYSTHKGIYYTALNAAQFGDDVAVAMCRELGEKAPEWIELIPAGSFTGRDGRTWSNDNPQAILQHFAHNSMMLPVDIEHSTDKKGAIGEPAPAVGWIEKVEERNGAVWGQVAWNRHGEQLIADREYRYYSPAFYYHPKTHQVAGIKHAGLTNVPNLNFTALNRAKDNSTQTTEEEPMALLAILTALSLPATASETDAVNAIGTLKTDHATALNRAESPDADKFVPKGTYDLALNRAEKAETTLKTQATAALEGDIKTAVEKAVADKKIAPADSEYYTAMCRNEGGLDQFKSFVESTPGVISTQGDDASKKPDDQKTALNREEAEVAKQLGMSADEFAEAKKASATA